MLGFRLIFPMALHTWSTLRLGGEFSHPRVAFTPAQAIEAVNVIRVTRKVHILPGALYACAQLPPSTLLAGTTRADGTEERMTPADLQLCFEMKERLRAVAPQMAVRWLTYAAGEKCSNRENCTKEQQRLLTEACRAAGHESSDLGMAGDPLNACFEKRLDAIADARVVCDACVQAMREELDEMRAQLWDKLPAYAGVEYAIRWWGAFTIGY